MREAASKIRSEKSMILQDIATRLTGLARLYFDTLAAGGTVAGGIKWKPLSQATIKRREQWTGGRRGKLRGRGAEIGVVTGRMRESLTVTVSDGAVKLSYEDRPTSNYFSGQRQLLPQGLMPYPWYASCLKIVKSRLPLTDGGSRTSATAFASRR